MAMAELHAETALPWRADANGIAYGGFWRRVVAWIIDWLIVSTTVSIVLLVVAAFVPNLGKVVKLETPLGWFTTERTIDNKTSTAKETNGQTITNTEEIVQKTVLGTWTYHYKITSTVKDHHGSYSSTVTTGRQIDPVSKEEKIGVDSDDIAIIVLMIYWMLMEASRYQASIGKLAVGLKVTDEAGQPLTLPRAVARNLLKIVSMLILGIGFLMAGWTRRKQALHDKLGDCYLVRSR
jgi:uncharacterized RDD family membrane protein YckC